MPFSHEKLEVYQASIRFVAWSTELVASISSGAAVKGQLDRASTSIPLNIAEGNGKFSARDRRRFLQIANGSALECAACLDVIVAKRLKMATEVADGKAQLESIVKMIYGLMRRMGDGVVGEEGADYGASDVIEPVEAFSKMVEEEEEEEQD